jgi:L-seryl-tRNA(Ser) seleniumtransferase
VKGIPSVRTETVVPKIANHDPHLPIRFDPEVTGVTTDQIVEALRSGKPSIELNPNTGQKPNQGIPADANTLVVGDGCCGPVKMRSLANAFVRFSPKKRDLRLEPTNSACPEVNQRPSKYPEIGAYA